MIPGVDFVGTVEASADPRFKAGDAVLLNGFGVGKSHWGGLSERARVNADWLIPLPAGLSAARAMALGTAGYTAMLCVIALERQGVAPAKGDIIVTGASGGVGGVAIIDFSPARISRRCFDRPAAGGRLSARTRCGGDYRPF